MQLKGSDTKVKIIDRLNSRPVSTVSLISFDAECIGLENKLESEVFEGSTLTFPATGDTVEIERWADKGWQKLYITSPGKEVNARFAFLTVAKIVVGVKSVELIEDFAVVTVSSHLNRLSHSELGKSVCSDITAFELLQIQTVDKGTFEVPGVLITKAELVPEPATQTSRERIDF